MRRRVTWWPKLSGAIDRLVAGAWGFGNPSGVMDHLVIGAWGFGNLGETRDSET